MKELDLMLMATVQAVRDGVIYPGSVVDIRVVPATSNRSALPVSVVFAPRRDLQGRV